jgi:hypothetical protein
LDAIGTALGNVADHPLDSAAAAYSAGTNYFANTGTQQIGEDALRFVTGGLATDGIGRVALSGLGAAGSIFTDSLPSAGAFPSLAAQEGSASLELLVPGGSRIIADTAPVALDALAAFRAANPISARVLDVYQAAYDDASAIVEARDAAGAFDDVSPNLLQAVKGQQVDSIARADLKAALSPGGDLEDLSDSVRVNRRLYDAAGSGNYRVPDVYIPSEDAIFDGTIGIKTINTPQVTDFFGYSNTKNVVIVTPNGIPQLIARPAGLPVF